MTTQFAAVTTYRAMPWLERGLVAVGLAGALVASRLLPAYPVEWRAVLALLVLALALWLAPVGYFAAVAVAAVPLWQFSPYLMVLFLALAVIPHRLILSHLPLALLVVWSPAFITLHMELALPILVGLLGGVGRGAVAGAASALWFKLLAALSGSGLDLLVMQAPPGDPGKIAARMAGLGSMDTVIAIVAPFAPSSAALLVNLLQVGAWAAAGACAGWLVTWGTRRLVVSDLRESPAAWRLVGARFLWTGLVPVLVSLAVLLSLEFFVPALVARPLGGEQIAAGWATFAPRVALTGAVLLLLAVLIVVSQPLPKGTRRWQPWKGRRRPARPAPPQPQPKQTAPPAPPKPALPPLPKVDPNRPYVPSWAANRVLPIPPPDAPRPAARYSDDDRARHGERDIMIELD